MTTHGAAHRATHGTALHRAGAVRALRTGTVAALGAMAAGAGGQLRSATGQLGGTHLRGLLLLYRLRTRYGGGHRGPRPVLLLRRFTHSLLLCCCWFCAAARVAAASLARRSSFSRSRRVSSDFDLVEEGIDLVLVIAFSEADGRELLVPHVLGGQRHLFFTST